MRTCPSCGRDNPVQSKFCAECGARLVDESAPQEVRKTVSVLFCDVAGSTQLGENADPETLRRIMSGYFETARQVLESHGGVVEKFIGDAVMAVFGIPQIHEDDALRAVRAAVGIRDALADLNFELTERHGAGIAIRTGVNTGEVVAGDPASGQALVTGDAVNVAARLEQAARPDEILIGPTTHRLVRDAVTVETVEPMELKGKSEPMPAFRVLDVAATGAGTSRRLDSPLVGREKELALLTSAFEGALAAATCRLATVIGTAGLGKSRLTQEFIVHHADTRSVIGRCLPYGDGITFWPLLEIIDELAGIRDDDEPDAVKGKLSDFLRGEEHADLIAQRISGVMSVAENASSVEETFWAVRRFLEAGARKQPLIVVVDDIHWAEPTLLDLLEYIAGGSLNAPIFLLTNARPELLDVRPAWARAVPSSILIELRPISPAESDDLLRNLLGEAALPKELIVRITEAAEGTPLFVEEMFSMLIDDGKLQREDGDWKQTGDLNEIEVPPTIYALLAARLDRLSHEEREVLGCASVTGKTFWSGAVASLLSDGAGTVTSQLMSLVRKELILPTESTLAGEDAFRFRHILIRDAAYEALPKEKRIHLHERFADWINAAAGDRAREYDEIVGYHLATAAGYAMQLGHRETEIAPLAERAASLLDAAGRRALNRGDLAGALNLLMRTAELMAMDSERRVEILLTCADLNGEMGMFQESTQHLQEARQVNASLKSERLDVLIRLHEARAVLLTTEDSTAGKLAETVHALIPELEAMGDAGALAKAWNMIGYTNGIFCRARAQVEALHKAIHYAREAGDLREELDAAWWSSFAIGQTGLPPDRITEEIEALLAPLRGKSRLVEVSEFANEAHVLACAGDADGALAAHIRSREVAVDIGYTVVGWSGVMETAWLLTPFERFDQALEILIEGNEQLERLGEIGYRSTVLVTMAGCLYELGRYEEASTTLDEVERISWADDIVNGVEGRAVRAKLAARDGDVEAAHRLARESIAIYDAAQSDFANLLGHALYDMSETFRITGHVEEARKAAQESLAIFEAKQYRPWCERVRKQLDRLERQVAER